MDEPNSEPSKSDIQKIEKILTDLTGKKSQKIRRTPKDLTLKEKKRLAIAIGSSLSELIDCYILLGFDVNGNSIVLINSSSDLENRALTDLVENFISSNPNSIGLEDDDF
jgi:hypothetical protein